MTRIKTRVANDERFAHSNIAGVRDRIGDKTVVRQGG
jgi:hypothetical protein